MKVESNNQKSSRLQSGMKSFGAVWEEHLEVFEWVL